MEQEETEYTIATDGFIELISDNELRIYSTIEELAESFGADSGKLKESWGNDEKCMAGHCNKIVTHIKDKSGKVIKHKITCKAGGSCSTPSECHIIKMWMDGDDPKEEDLGKGPETIVPKKGTAYICRCVA